MTEYTNSDLIDKTILSPNHYNGRIYEYNSLNEGIYIMTPHCMAYDGSIESCGNGFANPARNASSNYGIESSGRMALYVEEKNGSWCTSNRENDIHAITVEIACEPVHPYKMTDKAIEAYIDLTVDVMQRNGLKKLVWKKTREATEKYQRKYGEAIMTIHRWYAAKACPGDYFISKIPYIVKQVNLRLERNHLEIYCKKFGSYQVQTTVAGVRCYMNLGGKVVRRVKKGYKFNVAKVAIFNNELWGQGRKSKQWFRLKYIKAI